MRLAPLVVLFSTCTLVACAGEDVEPDIDVPPITAITFNVHGKDAIEDAVIGQNMAAQITALAPHFVALQECVACEALVAWLPPAYRLITDPDSAVAIVYDATDWDAVEDGAIQLGVNDDGWGAREARWARFSHRASGGRVDVYSTHWCVTIRRPDDACDVERHMEYAQAILDHHAECGARHAIIAGDFNVFDGFEDGPVVAHLLGSGLVDTFREVSDADVITFQGNDWAPAGRIDYVFATAPVDVLDGMIDISVPPGQGSDHYPVSATLSFSAQ